jgi:hypothetical protein
MGSVHCSGHAGPQCVQSGIGAATRHDKKAGKRLSILTGRRHPHWYPSGHTKSAPAAAGARADRGIHQSFNRDAIEQSFLGGAERLHGLRRRAAPRRRRHLAGICAERMITPTRRCCRSDTRVKRLRRCRRSKDGGKSRRGDRLLHDISPSDRCDVSVRGSADACIFSHRGEQICEESRRTQSLKLWQTPAKPGIRLRPTALETSQSARWRGKADRSFNRVTP